MNELTLVFPHQLYPSHPAVAKGRPILMVEDPLFFGKDRRWPGRPHLQRLVLHRASMEHWAETQAEKSFKVRWARCSPQSSQSSEELWDACIPQSVRTLYVADPVDDLLSRRLKHFARQRDLLIRPFPSPNFLTPQSFLDEQFGRSKKPFMARFYEAQRRRMNLLITSSGEPEGGQWSFDQENRKRLPNTVSPPALRLPSPDKHLASALKWVEKNFPENPGKLDAFWWPTTRNQALNWLEQFLDERFRDFGAYEDAIAAKEIFLFHSALTPALNIGLLQPDEIIQTALSYARKHRVPLNSLEGFIRQIIGWREFMRAMYDLHGRRIRITNHWQFTHTMPDAFYKAKTGIPPIDLTIEKVIKHGWCHHIERLMVLGNFMLLCRIHPDGVYQWFMDMFVDAYDWVMVPNVYGMSQFADGGLFTTKPYLSGSNYILKMSDYPKGPWTKVWDALFWTFIADHLSTFAKNPRMSMMARSWERLEPSKKKEHYDVAGQFLKTLHGG